MTLEVRVYDESADLALAVAEEFRDYFAEWLATHELAHVVLTGGRTGSATLAEIRSLSSDSLDWSRIHFWWGDERWLPAGDTERNEVQADAALLSWIDIPAENVHRCAASDDQLDLDTAAERYADELRTHAAAGAALPPFALVFLGMGPDGHVASLFPHHPALHTAEELTVVAVEESPKPPSERISLTLAAINSANAVWVMLSGADKADALEQALSEPDFDSLPASAVAGTDQTMFFVDAAAAAGLTSDES